MTRRMMGTDGDRYSSHTDEHDYYPSCDVKPRCIDLDPDAVHDAGAVAAYRPPPDHYSTGAGIDPWAVWDAFDLDRYTANAVKYLLRAGKKDIAPRLDDLKKARDYVNKAIEREEQRG